MPFVDEKINYIHLGGWVMWPLILSTFALWYGLGYRWSVLRRGNRRSVRVLLKRYLKGYDREPKGIIDTGVVKAIEVTRRTKLCDRSFLDDVFVELKDDIDRFSVLVRTIVLIAPLLGLLGTVSGMIKMFDSLGDASFYTQSGGIAGGTTGEIGFTYDGGDMDWLGFDDGTRELPSILPSDHIHPWSPNGGGYHDDELNTFGRSFNNTWDVDEFTVPYNIGFSSTIGNQYKIGSHNNAGFLLAFTYSNEYHNSNRIYNNYGIQQDELNINDSFDFEVTNRDINLGGVLDLGLEIGDNHSFKLTSLVLRITEDRARQYEGYAGDQGDYIRVTSLRWIEQMLWTEQLSGNHNMPFLFNTNAEWIYTYSLALRDEPDRRDIKYEYDDNIGGYKLSTLSDGNHRIFSELDEYTHDFNLRLSTPYSVWKELEAKLRTGFMIMYKDRTVDTRRFYYNRGSNIDGVTLTLPPEEIFRSENIGEGYMEFRESTLNTDHYEANQLILAYYLISDFPLTLNLDVSGGFRIEMSEQKVETFNIHSNSEDPVIAELKTTDFLPALTFTWRFAEDQQIRLGYSNTVSRPDFRELSPATYNDVVGGREIQGNPDVQRALIHNYDVRWEWYPTTLENISFGLFYKDFIDPIEHTIDGGTNQRMSFANADGAINYGVEFEF